MAVKKSEGYVVAVDVGTTNLTCHVFDKTGISMYGAVQKVQLLYPRPGWVEIDPDVLWDQFLNVVTEAVEGSCLQYEDITAFGISTQRGTFLNFDKRTGRPIHNFITWQDLRAAELTENWNRSFTMKGLHLGAKALHLLSRRKQFLAASVINFSTQHVSMRLHWMLKNHAELMKKARQGSILFATIDTWLLWKLTKGQVHITDYSNASSTGMFDPYVLCWSSLMTTLFEIPVSLLPEVVETSGSLCEIHKDIFGTRIPVTAVVADQQASVFGQCCFDVGDINLTMGTGSFININTGKHAHASVAGLYPLVGWKIGSDVTYLAEGNAAGTGTAIEWAGEIDCNGVYFVPAFSGLQAPINDTKASTSIFGITSSTSKAHIVRAVLESIAYRIYQLFVTVQEEIKTPIFSSIKADGGLSQNDFIMQLLSTLTEQSIERPKQIEMSCLGAAFLAGLATGVWKSRDELKAIHCSHVIFQPCCDARDKYEKFYEKWKEAQARSRYWYT
ncbi:putative glycerol kinase 5 isoform X2 [Xenia sp. Carnegie-2017]|uniref:putative glycerol kinase 5 isoform X2 n=1 Tax=Xenia sp. Carnegie-2017 TaxID=2897299 RepID=UPI001F043E8B|nr:putative glycerol kinase 5 isoform X2 [Xenia sp. Carnegie-2017]